MDLNLENLEPSLQILVLKMELETAISGKAYSLAQITESKNAIEAVINKSSKNILRQVIEWLFQPGRDVVGDNLEIKMRGISVEHFKKVNNYFIETQAEAERRLLDLEC